MEGRKEVFSLKMKLPYLLGYLSYEVSLLPHFGKRRVGKHLEAGKEKVTWK